MRQQREAMPKMIASTSIAMRLAPETVAWASEHAPMLKVSTDLLPNGPDHEEERGLTFLLRRISSSDPPRRNRMQETHATITEVASAAGEGEEPTVILNIKDYEHACRCLSTSKNLTGDWLTALVEGDLVEVQVAAGRNKPDLWVAAVVHRRAPTALGEPILKLCVEVCCSSMLCR